MVPRAFRRREDRQGEAGDHAEGADIDLLYDVYSSSPKQGDGRPEWGDRAVWEELHRKDPFPFWLD